MNRTLFRRLFLCLALLSCALPLLIIRIAEEAPAPAAPLADTAGPTIDTSFDQALTLRVQTADGVAEMDLQTYLCGVLLAEMPAGFSPGPLRCSSLSGASIRRLTSAQSPPAVRAGRSQATAAQFFLTP